MAIHPKILERANIILEKDEEEALKQIDEISNITVLNALYELESNGQKRQPIVDCLKSKLGIEGDEAPTKEIETLANQYLDNIVESEEETFVFDTTALRDKKEEEEVDSSTNSTEHSESS